MMRWKKNNIVALFGFKKECVKLFLFLCADVLIGIKEAIAAAFPRTEYQRCIVHQVRNTLEKVTEKWSPKYLKYQIKTQNYIL